MHTARAYLKSAAPYSASKNHITPYIDREAHDDYEKRTWREKAHVNADGKVIIPPQAFKNMISDAAKYKGVKIKGKGHATYTKHFDAGVLVIDPIVLPINKDDLESEAVYCDSNGKRGSGSRVWRYFPIIPKWEGWVTFIILDDTITRPVWEDHLADGGNFIGIGRWRPIKRGMYGRFSVEKTEWE